MKQATKEANMKETGLKCRDLDLLFAPAATTPLPADVEEHLAGCERCRRLFTARSEEAAAMPEDLTKHLRDQILADLKPVQPLPANRTLDLLFLGIASVGLLIGLLTLMPMGWQAMVLWQRALVIGSLCVGLASMSYLMTRLMVPGSKMAIAPSFLLLAVPVLMLLSSLAAFPFSPGTFESGAAIQCGLTTLVYSVPALVLSGFLLRRGASLDPRWSGAVMGLFAGSVGAVVLQLHCPVLEFSHTMAGHMLPALGLGVMGWLAGMIGAKLGATSR